MTRLFLATLLLASSLQPVMAVESGPSYADVLRRPDDVALNLAYAQKLVRQGHVNSASATLERILLTHPEADDARLMYMIVLYRLDDMTGAKRESDILATRKLSPALQGEYDRYTRQIVSRAKPTRAFAYWGTGIRVDSNAVFLPDADLTHRKARDVSLLSMAGVSVEHDVNIAVLDKVFAQFDLGASHHFRESDYSQVVGTVEAGGEKRIGNFVLRGSAFASRSFLDGDVYARQTGGRLKGIYELTSQLKIFANVEISHRDFSDVTISGNADLHDGWKHRYGGGIAYQVTDSNLFTVQAHWVRIGAVDAGYAYDSPEVEAKWLGTFYGGQYMTVGALYATSDYKAEDIDYFVTRDDSYWRARASYGLPVRTLGEWAGVDTSGFFFNFGELVLQTSIDYTVRNSNIDAYDYRNLGAEVMLTRRFVF